MQSLFAHKYALYVTPFLKFLALWFCIFIFLSFMHFICKWMNPIIEHYFRFNRLKNKTKKKIEFFYFICKIHLVDKIKIEIDHAILVSYKQQQESTCCTVDSIKCSPIWGSFFSIHIKMHSNWKITCNIGCWLNLINTYQLIPDGKK